MHTTLGDDRFQATRARAGFASAAPTGDEPKRPNEADEHQEEVLAAMIDELVVPEIRDERSIREINHDEQTLAGRVVRAFALTTVSVQA